MKLPWLVIALGLSAAVVFFAAARTRRILPPVELPPGEKLPSTPLQRLTRWCFVLILIASAVAFGIVWHHGVQVWWDDDPVRLTVTGVLLVGLGVFAVYFLLVGVWAAQESGKLDERDRAILARAPAGVGGAMMVVMAVWMIALTEGFRPAGGQMPTYFLYLIFWSCVMVNAMAHIGGVLIAYRRS
jgi:hypothetical protein